MKALVFAALLIGACSSSSEPTGPCALRHGSYSMSFRARTGDCGDTGEQVFTGDEDPSTPGATNDVASPCTGQITTAKDNCAVTIVDQRCPETNGGSSTLNGKINWAHDGAGGTGIYSLTAYDSRGNVICAGSYDVTFTKI